MPIKILESGIVEYNVVRNGTNWRTTIAPGDLATAKKLLIDEELDAVKKAWTPKVLKAWEAQQKAAVD